jgi:hypothetical protein
MAFSFTLSCLLQAVGLLSHVGVSWSRSVNRFSRRCSMSANKTCVMLLGVFVLCLATMLTATAQIRITQGPRDLEGNEYRVRIDSTGFGAPHTVGIFGRPKSSEIRISFDGGRRGPDVYAARLNGGMRIICIWDTDGDLVFFDSVLVDRNGTLRLPAAAAAAMDGAEDGHRGGLQIE